MLFVPLIQKAVYGPGTMLGLVLTYTESTKFVRLIQLSLELVKTHQILSEPMHTLIQLDMTQNLLRLLRPMRIILRQFSFFQDPSGF